MVTKVLFLRLMSEIGLLGFCSYSVAVEHRVDIVAVLTKPSPWLVLVIRAVFSHCEKLKKERLPTRTCAQRQIARDAVFRVLEFISYRNASQVYLEYEAV